VSQATRFALLYAAQFAGLGAMLPFLPAILAEGGLGADAVGAVLAAGSLTRVLAAPALGARADAAADPRRALALFAGIAALAAMGFGLATGFALLLAAQLLHSVGAAGIVPVSDALAGRAVRQGAFDYARVRAAGSLAFIAGAVLAGQAAQLFGPRAAAWMLAAALVATAAAALALPAPEEAGRGAHRGPVFAPLRLPGFARLLAVSALVQGSHAAYYAFSTLHWQAAGLSPGFIGLLWGVGVAAEVLLFWRGGRLAARLGLRGLALAAALAGTLRWAGTAVTVEPLALLALNLLHGATFGAMHLAAMRGVMALPGTVAGRAQAWVSVASGAAMGLLMWASAPVFAATGGGVFLVMAGLAALAALIAAGLERP
jgi:PPP family 3-phenylpropionic acid transporter